MSLILSLRLLSPFQGSLVSQALIPGLASLACDYAVRTIHCQRQMHVLVQDTAACRAKSQVIQSDPVGGCAHPGLLSAAPTGAGRLHCNSLAGCMRVAEGSHPSGPEVS